MRILVTAGPTREFIDPVRYLSNRSTGTLGYALAARAVVRGHAVTLITGPVTLTPPQGAAVVRIVSAADLAREALAALPDADAVVMTAAVADFTPADTHAHKLKKASAALTLTLKPTTDVLAEIGRRKRADQIVMGFCLETENGPAEARRKLASKNCDFIVLNTPANFGDVRESVTVFARGGDQTPLPPLDKPELAARLIGLIEAARGKE
ncbi:MAG: Coenzyme A biosynthesis bifunctional protein CoaBC [Phycisphaerae bacterium]|nr:Coenzyme A biosynthesis bifunctional protein CoaBC [Phycisphaerae bacterium]